jgi:hypothetical protein
MMGWIFKGGGHGKASDYRIDCFDYANDLEYYSLPSFKEQDICKSAFGQRNDQSNGMAAMVAYHC